MKPRTGNRKREIIRVKVIAKSRVENIFYVEGGDGICK